MRSINVTNNVTLDGVMQAPGGHDELKMKIMSRGMARLGALLFGRNTYELA
jgi:hypothetical protein